jgi:chromosome transmission fidelity protein 4
MLVRSLPGPVVSMSGCDDRIVIVYHEGGIYHGNQSMSFILLDMEANKTVRGWE